MEYVCFQLHIEERRGNIGAFAARNRTKFWTTFLNPARFSLPDRGGIGSTGPIDFARVDHCEYL